MMRLHAVIVCVSIVILSAFGLTSASTLSFAIDQGSTTQRPPPSRWFLGLWSARKTPRVFVHGPKTSADTAIELTVATDLRGARRFYLDVDLDHDGRFAGAGELAYAEGTFDPHGAGIVRLRGLTPGEYQLRARAELADGSVVASAVERLEVLAPPSNYLPVAFEVNRGQTDDAVLFQARAKNQTIFVTRDETVLVAGDHVSRFRLAGANSWTHPVGSKKLPGIVNYFIGDDPARWRTHIETYQELRTEEVYPGIDLVYHSQRGRLQYDFHVAPGADPSVIGLEFSDAVEVSIDVDGALILRYLGGREQRHSAPILYQMQGERREAVKGSWIVKGRNQAGYRIADYDPRRELVIDPLIFSTYYGGNLTDRGEAIALDAAGNTYVAGTALSPNFPGTAGAFQATANGSSDAVVIKLNPTGTTVLYATFLGGNGVENGYAIAVDAAGNAYVGGVTGSNGFPTTAGVFQPVRGPGVIGFVAKLNPTGSTLLYSTFLGGSLTEEVNGIAIDAAGNAYVTGRASSNNFPTTPGAYQTAFSGAGPDAFIAKLNPTATALLYATYLGGSSGGAQDVGRSIAVDAAGNAYVVGDSSSSNFPTTPGAFQSAGAGGSDVFVTKLNPAGSALIYSTLVGGASTDMGNGVAIDPAGNAYVVGSTFLNSFPTTAGAFQTIAGGATDAFVFKLNPAGSALVYSAYLGGAANDIARGIAIDAAGNAYVAGETISTTFPTVNPLQPARGGGIDAFVSVINPAGSALVFSTYLGGAADDIAYGIAVDAGGAIYITGDTTSANFPTLVPVQAANAGGLDLFITKLTTGVGPPPPPPPPPSTQVLYAITGPNNQLLTVNTSTGAGTLVGMIPLPGAVHVGLGFRGSNLYSWDQTAARIRQLDPATAAVTSTIDIASTAFGEGDVTFRADGIGFLARAGGMPQLYRFDITIPNSAVIGPLTPAIDGLAFNGAGVLYGLKEGGDQLYTINPVTAVMTLVGNTGVSVAAGGNGALAFDASGNLYATLSNGGANPSTLYAINPVTGAATSLGPVGFNGVTGLSFQPPPGPPPPPPPPPGPPGSKPGEGTYNGGRGPITPANEGCFGFGGGMRTQPILHGPTPVRNNDVMVCNVAYRATNSDADHTATIVGIALVSLALGGLGFPTVRATAARNGPRW